MRGNQVKLLGNITSLSSFIWAVLLLGVMLGLTPKAGAVPTLDWTVSFSRTTGGDEGYRASTTFGGDTYVIYQDRFFGDSLVKFDATGAVLMDISLDVMGAFVTSMTVDSAGNIYAAGMVFDTAFFQNDLCVAQYSPAGNLNWVMIYDTLFDTATYGVATDFSGNVVVGGTFWNGTDNDAIVVKYDTSGVLQWARTVDSGNDDFGYAVTADGTDNVYLVGAYNLGGFLFPVVTKYDVSGVLQYDFSYPIPGEGRAATYSGLNDSVYVASDDLFNVTVLQVDAPTGVLTAFGTYSDVDLNIAGSIAVDGSGTVFVGGWTGPLGAPVFDIKVIEYNSVLTSGWANTYDSGGMDGLSVDFISPLGIFYAAVHVGVADSSSVNVTGSILTSDCIGTQNVFFRKYSKSGTIQWTQIFDKASYADAIGTVVDIGGDVYVGGAMQADPFLLKYNRKGQLQWAEYPTLGSLCGLDAEGLATSGDIIFLAASAWDSVSGINQVQIVKYAPDGTQVGALNFDLIPDSYPGPITLDDAGNLYLAGWFASTTTFQDELFVTKFDSTGAIQWTTTISLAADNNPADIALDGAGDLYVLESTPNDGVTNNKFVLAKFSRTSGGVLWTRTYSASPTLSSQGRGIWASGKNIYCVGNDEDPISGATWGRIYKLDTLGNIVWTKNYNGGQDVTFSGVEVDVFGNVSVTGNIGSAAGNTADILTLGYDPDGTLRWTLPFDSGDPWDVGTGLAIGSLYVAGTTAREARLLKYTEPATLIVGLVASPTTVMQGQNVTVVMTVGNMGAARAWSLAPSGEAGPAAPGMVSLAAGPSPGSTPWLDSGDSASFTWTYKATSTGHVDFTATVTGTGSKSGLPINGMAFSSTVFITPAAVLSATAWIVQAASSLKAGSTFVLMFSVSNTGAIDASAVLPSLTLSDPSLVRIDSGPVPSGTVTIGANSVMTFVWQLTVVSWDGGTLTLDASVMGTDLLNSVGLSATAQTVLNTKPKPEGQFVAYPNPIEGPPWRLNIYLRLNDDARAVTVDAYDAAIHRVYSGKWGFVAQVDGALEVDGLDQWAPGIYLLRARAELVNGSTQTFPVVKVVVK